MTQRNTFCFGLAILIVSCNLFCLSSGHNHGGHSHHHSEEAPSFKYSKEANQPYVSKEREYTRSHPITHKDGGHSKEKPRDVLNLWVESLLSTLLISAAPFIILFFIPIDNRLEHRPKLKVLLSFASGGLLGDAFLHLIPHALLSVSHENAHSSHSHSHSYGNSAESEGHSDIHGHDMRVGLWVLAGVVVFLMVEKFVRIVKGGHGHSHSPKLLVEANDSSKDRVLHDSKTMVKDDIPAEGEIKPSEDCPDCSEDLPTEGKNCQESRQDEIVEEKQENVNSDDKDVEDIKVAGYLNLAADFTHNFTDGLAIGASYLAGQSIGMVTTVTILLHEVPHEIGDFAILIQSGCSKRKAIMLQLLTAVGALTGTFCSLLADGLDPSATNWILPFTAGGFIYIATVSVIPELLEDTKFWQSVKEVIALLFGVFMMVLIAEYE